MEVLAGAVATLLALFTLRRCVFLAASLLPARPSPLSRERRVGILVPARNEEALVGRLLDALGRLDYPRDLLEIVLVNDGSSDRTGQILRERAAAAGRDHGIPARYIDVQESQGKPAALRAAAAACPPVDIYVSFDADCVPRADSVARLAGVFDDPRVGGVGGYPRPGNAAASLVSRYAAIERWVYHLVVLAGKDRLRANPHTVGAVAAYRCSALAEIGGFSPEYTSDDVATSLALNRGGWTTRYVCSAEVREDVVTTVRAFWRQRQRWGRSTMESAPRAHGVENLFVAAAYLDRVVALVAILLVIAGRMSPLWPAAYAAVPLFTILIAVAKAGVRNPVGYLVAAGSLSVLDLAASVTAAAVHALRFRTRWSTRRDRAY